jgi:hypothetical protein
MSKSLEVMTFDSGYAHGFKAGWEQAKAEVVDIARKHRVHGTADTIASMEYKEG